MFDDGPPRLRAEAEQLDRYMRTTRATIGRLEGGDLRDEPEIRDRVAELRSDAKMLLMAMILAERPEADR